MANKRTHSFSMVNDKDDPTYENWLALYACIINHKLTVGDALRAMGLNTENKLNDLEGGVRHES